MYNSFPVSALVPMPSVIVSLAYAHWVLKKILTTHNYLGEVTGGYSGEGPMALLASSFLKE